jgi:hypothetical protein
MIFSNPNFVNDSFSFLKSERAGFRCAFQAKFECGRSHVEKLPDAASFVHKLR